MSYGFYLHFIGNLGRDVEIKHVGDGGQIKLAAFSVACKVGRDEVEWMECSAFGRLADLAEQYLHKGSKVVITGTATVNRWQDQQHNERATVRVKVTGIDFAGSGRQTEQRSAEPQGAIPPPLQPDEQPF